MKRFLILLVYIIGFAISVTADTEDTETALRRYEDFLGNASDFLDEERFKEAIPLLLECQRLYPKLWDLLDEDISFYLLYECCVETDDFETLLSCSTEKAEMTLKRYGPSSEEYLQDLRYVIYSLSYLEKYDEAIKIGEERLKTAESFYEKDRPEYLHIICDLALPLLRKENGGKGRLLLEEVINKTEDSDDSDYIILFTRASQTLVDFYVEKKEYDTAMSYRLGVLEREKAAFKDASPGFLLLEMVNVAQTYDEIGNHIMAENLILDALDIAKDVYGIDEEDLGILYHELSRYQYYNGKTEEALANAMEAWRIREVNGNEDSDGYARLLNIIAVINADLGNIEKAVEIERQALDMRDRVSGTENFEYVNGLLMMALFYAENNRFEDVEHYTREALKIVGTLNSKNESENKFPIQDNLIWLINRLYESGKHSQALHLGDILLEVLKDIKEKDPTIYVIMLDNLATYYNSIGYFDKAFELCEESIKIFNAMDEETLMRNYHDYLVAMGNYVQYFNHNDNYEEVIAVSLQLIQIKEQLGEDDTYEFATLLHNTSRTYAFMGDIETAIEMEERTIALVQSMEGAENLYYVCLNCLADNYLKLDRTDEAKKYAIMALENTGRYDKNSPNYLMSLMTMMRICYKMEDYDPLVPMAKEMTEKSMEEIRDAFNTLSSEERKVYWDINGDGWFGLSLPLIALRCDNPEIVETAYDGQLFSKGILLNSEIEFDNFLTSTNSIDLADKYDKMKRVRAQLSKLYELPVDQRKTDTDSLERVANNLERELIYESKEFGEYTGNLSLTWQDVQKGLGEKDIAIEFVSLPVGQDSTLYMAYLLKAGMVRPQKVTLFEEKELQRLDQNTLPVYANPATTELVWGKIRPYLDGVDNVYFAPDGELHRLPIEYLLSFEGNEPLSDQYGMYRLSSTRELARGRKRPKSGKASVYGGIKYDSEVASMEKESKKYDLRAMRGAADFDDLAGMFIERGGLIPLPHSAEEAQDVARILEGKNYETSLKEGETATEESFKILSGQGCEVIHLATHGFYLEEETAERMAQKNDNLLFMTQTGDGAHLLIADRALSRSGLFMAGAQNVMNKLKLPNGVEDGILTAQEIAYMDLQGADLIVLSACQTGLGEIGSDGVFGLQRGFKKAGAGTLLMTLWEVDDLATAILMRSFYENYLGGMSKLEALQAAQKTLRGTPGYSAPYYWAAFILLDAL